MEMKLTLKQMVLNEIDNGVRGFAEVLAKISGTYSNGSNLKKVLNDPKKEFESINGFIRIVNYIWGKDTVKMIVKFSEEVDPNKKTARNLLEYLVNNRQFEAFNKLLDRMDGCKNNESLEYARIYRMQYKYELAHTSEDYISVLKEINDVYVTVFELKVYKKMLLNYCFDQLHDYKMVKQLSKELEQEVEQIENEYIKEMYTLRAHEIIAYNHLFVFNDTEASIKSADKIIMADVQPAYKAYAYFVKGFSYLFTSYDNAIKYLTESKNIYDSIGRAYDVEDLTKKIEFVQVYWDKLSTIKCSHIENQLLLDIKNGKDVSIELEENEFDPEVKLYLDGINSSNTKKLMLSYIKFIKKNNLFVANIVRIELLKNDYDEEILDEIAEINLP